MTTPYILGKSVEEYNNPSATYLYALRRTEDGDLYLLKVSDTDPNADFQLFGEEVPAAFDDYQLGDDFFNGRGEDHELSFSSADVKYEQWKWVNAEQTYYIDSDGNFTLDTSKLQLSEVEDIQIPTGHQQTFTIVGENYNINLYDKLISMGWNGLSEAIVTINGNIGSTHPSKPALTIDKQFKNGVSIINNGNIIGCNGNLQNDPVVNRYNGYAILIETAVESFTNTGLMKAGVFNSQYANVFRGYANITTFSNTGTWIGYDD